MLFLDRQLDEFRISGYMDHLVTKQIFTFDTEEHIAIADRNRNHHRRRLSGAERVFVDDDLETVAPVTEIGSGIGSDKDISLCFDRWQKAIALRIDALTALPRDAVITFFVGSEIELCDRLRRQFSLSA